MMAKPERLLRQDDASAKPIADSLSPRFKSWIEANDFVFLGAYRFTQIRFAAWRKRGGATDLIVYATPFKFACDLVTRLQDNMTLTTTVGGETGMFPQTPGDYKESVLVTNPDDLDAAHSKSLSILAKMRGVRVCDIPPSFEDALLRNARDKMTYVKSLPFWPVRGVYWYFVKRQQMRNKTIEEQIQQGMI
jgi:hypothetical protein